MPGHDDEEISVPTRQIVICDRPALAERGQHTLYFVEHTFDIS
jgi:hypothetical protein